MTFSKGSRLLKRREFLHLSKVGQKRHGTYLVLQLETSSKKKLGITATRKYGKAVARNRFKRLVREAFRLSDLPLCHLNVFPTKSAHTATFNDIKEELANLTRQKRE